MRVWISDFLALLYTRLLSFCLVLFAAWSAFFTGLAAAAARTNTGRLANGTTTREVHDTPSNKKKHIHRQNPHNPGQIRFTPPKKKHQNPKPWTNSHFARSAATRLTAGFVPANSKQSSYPTLPPSTVTIHNPSPIHKLTSHRIPLQMGMEGTTNEERERTEQPSPSPSPPSQPTAHWLICYSPNTLNRFELHVKSRRWPWSRVPAKEERSGTEAEERCAVQTEAEGEAANASDDSDEVTLEHAMAIAAPSPAMQCGLAIFFQLSNLSQFSACLRLSPATREAMEKKEKKEKEKP